MSVSFVRRIAAPCWIRLFALLSVYDQINSATAMSHEARISYAAVGHTRMGGHLLLDLVGIFDVHFPETFPNDVTLFILPNLHVSLSTGLRQEVD